MSRITTFLLILLTSPLFLYAKKSYKKNDSLLVKEYLDKSLSYEQNNIVKFDSALYYINEAMSLSEKLNYNTHLIPIYKHYSELALRTDNYTKALAMLYKAIEQLDLKSANNTEDINIHKDYMSIFSSMGYIYLCVEDQEKALNFFELALEENDKIKEIDENYDANKIKAIIYNNISSIYIHNNNHSNSLQILQKALIENQNSNQSEKEKDFIAAKIYNNLGISNSKLEDYEKAFNYYNKTLTIYLKYDCRDALPQIYNNIGYCHYKTGNFIQAIDLLKQSAEISHETLNPKGEEIAINMLATVYSHKNDFKNAYLSTRKELSLIRNLFEKENHKHLSSIEEHHNYEKKLRQELLEKETALARKETIVLIYILITLLLTSVCFILLIIQRNYKLQLKQQSIKKNEEEKEKKDLRLQINELKKDIEDKNKQLATYVMFLNQKSTLITSLTEQLTELSKSEQNIPQQKLSYIIKQMKVNLDNISWEEFNLRFQDVHQDFYTKLNQLFPDLTLNEKRLCAFLKLNMTTKEISAITFQSVKSIQIARIRLRKKLQIEKDENLISVLQTL